MIRKLTFVLVVLASLDFFEISVIPETVQKTFGFLGIALTLFFLILFYLYEREPGIPEKFNGPILIIMVGIIISMFGAMAFHEQSFGLSVWGSRFVFFYLFYFLLSKLRLEPDYIIRFSILLGFTYMILYIVQHTIFPREILSARMFYDRGTLRIFMPGSNYLVMAYFICFYYLFKKFKLKYLIYLLLSLIVYILLGTRQVIASVGLVTILFFLQSRVIKAKYILIPVMILSVIPFYFMFQGIFDAMLDVTSHQSSNVEGDIRFRAMKFFLFEFFPNTTSYFIGNGMAGGNSAYARQIGSYMDVYGFFMSDLGLIGDYVRFGVLYIIGVVILFIKVLRTKFPEKYMFIKYYFYVMLLTLFTGGSAFADDSNIVSICIILYLIDYLKYNPEGALKEP